MEVKLTSSNNLKGVVIEIDGERFPVFYEVSRKLTETTAEDYDGIFTRETSQVSFSRSKPKQSVSVHFEEPWNPEWSLKEMERQIKFRVESVNKAFEKVETRIFTI